MVASIYVALTMETLSSLASTVDAARGRRKSHNASSSTRHCRFKMGPP
jgi:hypothetical protein